MNLTCTSWAVHFHSLWTVSRTCIIKKQKRQKDEFSVNNAWKSISERQKMGVRLPPHLLFSNVLVHPSQNFLSLFMSTTKQSNIILEHSLFKAETLCWNYILVLYKTYEHGIGEALSFSAFKSETQVVTERKGVCVKRVRQQDLTRCYTLCSVTHYDSFASRTPAESEPDLTS